MNLDPSKPAKCKHCGRARGKHKAKTYQCPAKWSKGRVGFTYYLETVFEANDEAAVPSAIALQGGAKT